MNNAEELKMYDQTDWFFYLDPEGFTGKVDQEFARTMNRAALAQGVSRKCTHAGHIDGAHGKQIISTNLMCALIKRLHTIPGAYGQWVEVYDNGAVNLMFYLKWDGSSRPAGAIRYRKQEVNDG